MLNTQQDVPAFSPSRLGRFALVLAALCVLAALVPSGEAAEPARDDGLFLSVPNPITDGAVAQLRNKIDDTLKRDGRRITKIIFDFNPTNSPSGTPNPYPCLSLADYLRGLQNKGVRTVAFVPNEVTRHSVMPVLACKDLVMSDNAEIGDVLAGQNELLPEAVRFAYERLAEFRNPLSPALVLKMLDKNMAILKGKTRQGNTTRYVDKAKLKEAVNSEAGFKEYQEAPGLQPGTARYKASTALSYGLCTEIINTRERVARAYGLSQARLREDVLQGQTVHPWLIEFSGSVTQAQADSVQRQIERAIGKGGNLLILQLDCEGGDTQAARDFGAYLKNLKDDKGSRPVKTVAFIPPKRSLGAATAVALGCTEIIMANDKDTALGDFDHLKNADPARYALMRKALVGLAEEQWYPSLLIQGTLDKDLEIFMVRSKADPTYHFPVSGKEFEADQSSDKPKWDKEEVIKPRGEFLKLTAEKAYKFGIARQLVDDLDGVYRYYQVEAPQVKRGAPDMLDEIATFFRNPFVRILLVMIGIVGLILEMKMPGVGLPGVVAAVCFVLFFWANSSVGHFTMLAVLLFVLGLILIGLEVFVLPGMAVFGVSGVVLVVSSLVLVTLEKAPTTSRDWWSLGMTLTSYTLSGIGAIVGAFLLARYLPQIPYANRLILAPPADRADPFEADKPGRPQEGYAALLGAIGEAATTLRPSGKARFGEQFLDVVAEGSYVPAGKRVQVIEIEGNRIVVKEV